LKNKFRKLVEKEPNNKKYLFKYIGEIIQELIENSFKHEFNYPPFSGIQYTKDVLKNELIETRNSQQNLSATGLKIYLDVQKEVKFENAASVLFLFCIITCRPAMAKVFWEFSNVSFNFVQFY
jgi:hypothetical protein